MFINLIIFFFIGCLLLFFLTLFVYKTGIVHKTRNLDGHLKKRQSIIGLFIMFSVFIFIVSFFVMFGVFSFNKNYSFLEKIIWAFILMIFLVFFDSFFIDLFLIGKLRPLFLNIPIDTTFKTMKIHVIKTFTIGWIFIIPIIIISTGIVHYIIK